VEPSDTKAHGARRAAGRGTATAFFVCAALVAWYLMMLVHELGHVLGALVTGGRIAGVVWHPLEFSRTDLSQNPHPLPVVIAGPLLGSALPIVLWLASRVKWQDVAVLLRGFAGFCLVANGAYLASAIVMPVGDTQDLVRLGAPAWLVALPGVALLGFGLALWNGVGAQVRSLVTPRSTITMGLSLLAVLVAMLVWSWLG
jgi:hypothetical protein